MKGYLPNFQPQLVSSEIATTPTCRVDPVAGYCAPASTSAESVTGFSSKEWRQVGHDECDMSHVSMHLTWKPWLHLGRTRTFSPSMNSPRQMGQSVAGMLASAPYTTTGIWRRVRFFRPVAARRAASSCGFSKANRLPHRSAHRMIEFSPSAQMSAQSRAARMITMLVSKLASLL